MNDSLEKEEVATKRSQGPGAEILERLRVNSNMSNLEWEMVLTAKADLYLIQMHGEFVAKRALELQDDQSLEGRSLLTGFCEKGARLAASKRDCMGQCYRLGVETIEVENEKLRDTYGALRRIRMKYKAINDVLGGCRAAMMPGLQCRGGSSC